MRSWNSSQPRSVFPVHLPAESRMWLPGYAGPTCSSIPARWEGFGLALLEAMLASLPIVATNVSSIPEIVADGETGLLVPPDDPSALAEAIVRTLDSPGDLGQLGRARAREEFSVARMADRTHRRLQPVTS